MEILTKQEQIKLLDSYLKPIMDRLDKLSRMLEKTQPVDGVMLKRSQVAKELGLNWHQVGAISYEKGKEQPTERKRIGYVRISGNYLYSAEDVANLRASIKTGEGNV